jgi:nucleoside-diphosphate-sugar epimerase
MGSARIPIAVTGASGFVGRAIADLLHIEVLPVNRSLDIDPRAEALIHLAWHAKPSDYLVSPENVVSADYAIATARATAKRGIPFVGVGTCAEYRASTLILVEGDPTNAGSVYAREKLRALEATREICEGFDSGWIWSRIFYPFGPGEHPDRLVPQVVRALSKNETFSLGPCDQIRDQIDVRDVAEALALLGLLAARPEHNDRLAEGIFNVSTGSAVPLCEWLGIFAGDRTSLLQFADATTDGVPQRVVGSSDRLRSLGWTPNQPSPPHWSSLVS